MSQKINKFIRQHEEFFKRNKKGLELNEWNIKDEEIIVNDEGDLEVKEKSIVRRKALLKSEVDLVSGILSRLKHFINLAEGDRHLKSVKKFIEFSSDIIYFFIFKCNSYIDENPIEIIDSDVKRMHEIMFQDEVFGQKIKIQDELDKLNLDDAIDSKDIKFFKDAKASLVMKEPLITKIEDVKLLTEAVPVDWNIATSKEMYINMNPNDIPKWNHKKHYFEQDPVVLQFWTEEFTKIRKGITIGGYWIHPWLYFHLNFFRTRIPQPNGEQPNIQPSLRDNEWFFVENLKNCVSKEYPDFYEKAMLIYGTRRFGKSVIMASLAHWRTLTVYNASGTIVGGSSSDLSALTNKIKTSMGNIEPAFKLDINKQNWENGETFFGIKQDQSTNIDYSSIIVQNLEGGTTKKTQKTAGLDPSVSMYDEIGKYEFLKPYLAALPSFATPYGFKCITVLAGCVMAGTKVWDNEGNLVNIEKLKPKNGILGYNKDLQHLSREEITYWQPPHEKPCYRITTHSGRTLECSDDHPILYRSRNGTWGTRKDRRKKMYFKETKDLEVGNQIAVIESVPLFGNKEMWKPRLVGLLIGDGSYGLNKTPVLSNCDKEVNFYVHINTDYVTEKTYITKDGKVYEENRIRKICSKLRDLGIYGQTKYNKTLPKDIHSYRKKDICELIGGFFDADGSVQCTNKNNNIQITAAHKSILIELQLLLQKIGVHGGVKYCKQNKNNPIGKNGWYRLTIADKKSVVEFSKNVSFLCKYKQNALDKAVENLLNRKSQIPKETKNLRFERIIDIEYLGINPVYNLTAGTTHTYIANGIITHNTGGEADLSKNAMTVLANPEGYDLLPMDWDLLETKIDPDYITWRRRTFATFFPGQMAYEKGFIKEPQPFSEFLDIDNEELAKIEINLTKWKDNTEYLDQKIEDAKKEKGSKGKLLEQQRKVQYPKDPEDCFMSAGVNPFSPVDIKAHKERLIETGQLGRKVFLSESSDNGKIVELDASNKPLPDFPFPGGFIDSPIVLYEALPDYEPSYGQYIAGLDDYKQDQSDTDSVGSFTIYKRVMINDEWSCRVVATYAARPDPHKKFHRQGHMLLKAFNAICFMENEDMGFKDYLDNKRVTDRYLIEGVDFASELNLNHNGRRAYGWNPTTKNINHMMGKLIRYATEEIEIENPDGTKRTILGLERIPDIGILDEMLNYKKDGNFDRLRSFGSALMYAEYLDATWHVPKPPRRQQEEEQKRRPRRRNEMFRQQSKRGFF